MRINNVFKYLILFAAAATQTACSSFSGSGDYQREPGFRSQLAPARQALPLPVEIAQDIASITENGALIYENSNTENLHPPEEKVHRSKPKVKNISRKTRKSGRRKKLARSNRTNRKIFNKVEKKAGPLAFSKLLKVRASRSPAQNSKAISSPGSQMVYHKVQVGDSLMKIAFEKHGNIYRWREIYDDNRNVIANYNNLKVGSILTINNVEYVYIKRNGKPYLIRRGDTLFYISKRLYGIGKKWKKLWKNNPQLITHPDKIYAGLTLYYEPEPRKKPSRIRLPAKVKVK